MSAHTQIPLPAIPANLTEADMPGEDRDSRAMNFALYRRGILPQRSQRAILKRLGTGAFNSTGGGTQSR